MSEREELVIVDVEALSPSPGEMLDALEVHATDTDETAPRHKDLADECQRQMSGGVGLFVPPAVEYVAQNGLPDDAYEQWALDTLRALPEVWAALDAMVKMHNPRRAATTGEQNAAINAEIVRDRWAKLVAALISSREVPR